MWLVAPGETITLKLPPAEEFRIPPEAQRVLDAVREQIVREGERRLRKLRPER